VRSLWKNWRRPKATRRLTLWDISANRWSGLTGCQPIATTAFGNAERTVQSPAPRYRDTPENAPPNEKVQGASGATSQSGTAGRIGCRSDGRVVETGHTPRSVRARIRAIRSENSVLPTSIHWTSGIKRSRSDGLGRSQWRLGLHLKSREVQAAVGSNPTPSAGQGSFRTSTPVPAHQNAAH